MHVETTVRPQTAMKNNTPLFRLGQCVATCGVDSLVRTGAVNPHTLLRRHQCGDWGDLCAEDRALNTRALRDCSRIMSVYKVGEHTIWVITDADWATTTLLLPSEY